MASEKLTEQRALWISDWFDPNFADDPICNAAGDSHGITEGEVAALAREVLSLRATLNQDLKVPTPSPARGEVNYEAFKLILQETQFDLDDTRAHLTATEARLAEVEQAVREVCPLDNNEGYEDEDGDLQPYRIIGEDGDAILEADSPADAVRQMDRLWLAAQERLERAIVQEIPELQEHLAKRTQQRDEAVAIARDAIAPFARPEFCATLGGNVQGDASPVWGRNRAELMLGDFRRATVAAARLAKIGGEG